MAAFQVFMYGRFWVFTEAHVHEQLLSDIIKKAYQYTNRD